MPSAFKIALVVPEIVPDLHANLATIQRQAQEAAHSGAELVIFPEAALTGLVNNDDPAHDLLLGQPVPGAVTRKLADLSRQLHLWLAVGLLERLGQQLYDSALLFTPDGEIGLHYRRNSPGWHGKRADPAVYGHGLLIPAIDTPYGRLACLICGDLFDDLLVQRVRLLQVDWLLFPFAREFSDGSQDPARWERDELPAYLERVKQTGAASLMVNYLASASLSGDRSFGGAWAVNSRGSVIASWPLGKAGILYFNGQPKIKRRKRSS